MAHIQEKGWCFLIRIRDTGIFSALDLPETEEFDLFVDLSLTRKQTNEVKLLFRDRNHYRFIPASRTFDYLPKKKQLAAYLRENPGVSNKSYIARQLGMAITTVHKYYDEVRAELAALAAS